MNPMAGFGGMAGMAGLGGMAGMAGLGGMGGMGALAMLKAQQGTAYQKPADTKIQRDIYIGNLPPGINEVQLKMFMNEAIKEIAAQGKAVNPDPLLCNREVGHGAADIASPIDQASAIMAIRFDKGHVPPKFGFLEAKSKDEAPLFLRCNGISLLGQQLNVKRPKTFSELGLVDQHNDTWQSLFPGQPGEILSLEIQQRCGITMMGQMAIPAPQNDKLERELYIGNIPGGTTPEELVAFLGSICETMKLNTQPGNPVIGARIKSPTDRFAFIECRSNQETANLATGLYNVEYMGCVLRVRRPASYEQKKVPSMEDSLAGLLPDGMTSAQAMALAAATPAASMVENFFAGDKALNLSSHGAPMPKGKATKVLRLANMVTEEDLKEDEDYDEFVEDIREEAEKFGPVSSCKIPRSTGSAGFGFVFIEYAVATQAEGAAKALTGRQFNGQKVDSAYFNEDCFGIDDLADTGVSTE